MTHPTQLTQPIEPIELYFELQHIRNSAVYSSATIANISPIDAAIDFILDAEKTIITQLECSICIAIGCVLTVHRQEKTFVVTQIGSPSNRFMSVDQGRSLCDRMLATHNPVEYRSALRLCAAMAGSISSH
jgi:hypothetical protein